MCLTGNRGGMKQLGLANGFERSTKRTRRHAFLHEMLDAVPWDALVAWIAPYAPAGTSGRPQCRVPVLLRVHFLQQWFSLADEAAEKAFAGIDPGISGVPDATTILRFRHLFEHHDLAVALLQDVNALPGARGQMVRLCTLVDATIARAPSSTKERSGIRPPSGTRPGRRTSGPSACRHT